MDRAASRFFDVPRKPHVTSAGTVDLPILYFDVSNVVALFAAAPAGAERLLEGTGLEPVLAGGRAIAGLSFYEYRKTSVGSYNEVATAIFAKRRGARMGRGLWADLLLPPRLRKTGAYVVDLPVTTPVANAAGRELWGYPKFITPIAFRLQGRDVACTVDDPSGAGPIVTLAGRLGPGVPVPPLGLVTYTVLDDSLVRACVDVRGWNMLHAPGSVRPAIGPSTHRMAQNLNTLGLEGSRPLAVLATHRFQSRLNAGRMLGRPAAT